MSEPALETLIEFASIEQQEFVFDFDSEAILFSGPRGGGGKSWALCEKTFLTMIDNPGCFLAIFRKSYNSIPKTILRTWLRCCPPEWIETWNKTDNFFRLVNGSELVFLGLDDPNKCRSLELDGAGVEEATETEPEDWAIIEGCVGRGPARLKGQIYATTNPASPSHHLYQRFYTEGRGRVIEGKGNRFLPDSYFRRLGQNLKGTYRERYLFGKWVGMEGAVYDCWNPAIHLIDRFDIPAEWPRYCGIDFGYNNPFVCLWAALSPDDELYIYREIYMSHRLVEDHGALMMFLERDEKILGRYADHDAEGRATLEEKFDLYTDAADKDVDTGIQAVYSRLCPLDREKPRLFFLRDSLIDRDDRLVGKPGSVVEEFASYAWAPASKAGVDRDAPIKANDHGLDALRYLVKGVNEHAGDSQDLVRLG